MESKNSCHCCLLRPPEKDVKMPYTYLGKTEIYAEMLKDCFEIHLATSSNDECGICEVCVGRLRDASDFKLQVQRSQAELQGRLKGKPRVKDERALVKLEMSDDAEDVDTLIQLEVKFENPQDPLPNDGNETFKDFDSVSEMQIEYKRPVTKITKKTKIAKEEIVSDAAPCARQPTPVTSHRERSSGEQLTSSHQACTCDTCGQQFTLKSSLIRHMKAHRKIKVYPCEVCNKEFKRFKLLVAHKRIHKGEKPFSCEICNKKFRETASLIVHNRIHTGEKPFSCELCNKRFTQKKCLYSHKLTHTAKAYTCGVCNKEFTQKGNLKAHSRVHTGERPFHCEICKKQFSQQSSLNHHMRTHARGKTGKKYAYACKHCDKQFRTLFTFSCHERIHNGEKPYTCEICSKQFGRKDHLDRHKQLHTGIKRYCCEICGKQFTERSNMNAHKLIHSRSDPSAPPARRRRRPKGTRRDAVQITPPSDQEAPSLDQLHTTKPDASLPPPINVQSA